MTSSAKKRGAKPAAKKQHPARKPTGKKPKEPETTAAVADLAEPRMVRLRVSDILPWDGNPREHSAEQIRLLKKSLGAYGLASLPVVQAGTRKLIAGHGRLEALRAMGHTDRVIPVLEVDLDDDQAKAYAVTDNRLTDMSTWNLPALREILVELDNGAFDIELTGFTPDAMAELFDIDQGPQSGIQAGKDPDSAPPLATTAPKTQRGDLYLLGRHRLVCGDATVKADVDHLMAGHVADLVITDPPYGVSYESSAAGLKASGKASILNDALEGEAFQEFLDAVFENYARVSARHAAFYVFYASRFHVAFETAMRRAGLDIRAQIIWAKNAASFGFSQYKWKHEPVLLGAKEGATPLIYVPAHETAFYAYQAGSSPVWEGDRSQTTVWTVARETGYTHPTQKPVALLRRPMLNSSRVKGLVVDFFGGSGSTMITAEDTGRTCFTLELDPKFCDVIVARWEDLTGRRATHMRGGKEVKR
jgi:DNA modification methylase